jgi:hypothetical protein
MRRRLLMLGLGTCWTQAAWAQPRRRDGNWWQNLTGTQKLYTIVGFFDGLSLGGKFSYWKYMNDKDKQEAASLALDSYNDYASKYLARLTADQLVEGLDVLYRDFQNRRIMVEDGVWLVSNQIAGNPKVDEMIVNYRRNAVQD